jgi:hypothetical protein
LAERGITVIEVLTQRPIPPGFDTRDDDQVARHARIAVDAMAAVGVQMHWIRTYITEDSLFGVIVFESEGDLRAFRLTAGVLDQRIAVHRITRTIDPSLAGPKPAG